MGVYGLRVKGDAMCQTCERYNSGKILMENDTCFAYQLDTDAPRATIGVAPKRHIGSFFEMSYRENDETFQLARNSKRWLDKQVSPDGYNTGYNIGKWGGQPKETDSQHATLYVIPRFAGDVPATDVVGGILNILKGE